MFKGVKETFVFPSDYNNSKNRVKNLYPTLIESNLYLLEAKKKKQY
jgi:hypothetical protein